MTEELPESQVPDSQPRPVLPLEYGSHERQRPRSRLAFAGRVVAGFVGYIAVTVGWWRFAAGWHMTPAMAVAGWLAITVELLGLAFYLRNRHGRPGYGCGILLVFLIPLGVYLLLLGVCYFGRPSR